MSGFTKDAVSFLKALKANNNRDWFTENKSRYEGALKRPAEALSEDIRTGLETLTGLTHKAKIFRIHRDVRFSKDKTPYNAHLRMSFVPLDGPPTPPAWFFSLETDHVVLGVGVFEFAKGALETWRKRVDGADGAALVKIMAKLEKSGVRFYEPDLKRIPSGFAPDHPRSDLLRRKKLAAWIDYPDTAPALGPKAASNCVKGCRRLKPIYDWLMET